MAMVTVRWWIVVAAAPILVGVGVIVGYLVENTLHAPPSPPRISQNVSSEASPSRMDPAQRDPAMVAGAAFMAQVSEHKRRLENNSEDLEAIIFLGNANYDITRFEKASEYYQMALSRDPSNIRVRTDLATSYYSLGNAENALTEIRIVLERAPDHETALYNLGVILLDAKKDREGAIEAWESLLRINPRSDRAEEIKERIHLLKTQGLP